MPRYVSPGRTPSPSRSPSRSTSRGYTYTDGVYTPSDSNSRLPSPSRSPSRRQSRRRSRSTGRSTSRADSYYSRSPSRSPSRSSSRSRSTARTSGVRSRLSSVLDTSPSTGKEKAENVIKTSLVMLGAIGAASIAAHKFWPKGITYGDRDFWETEKEKKEKGKAKQEIREKLREGKEGMGGGPSRRDDGWSRAATDGGRDASRERRERYLQERLQERRRERLPLPAAVSGEVGANYWESRDKRQSARRYHDDYDDYGPPRDDPRIRRYSAADLLLERQAPQRRIEAPRPPPTAPNPPSHYADEPPPPPTTVIVPATSSRRGGSDRASERGREDRGGYHIERGSSIVLPSTGERDYVIRREAPPGQRLRMREGEREDGYHR